MACVEDRRASSRRLQKPEGLSNSGPLLPTVLWYKDRIYDAIQFIVSGDNKYKVGLVLLYLRLKGILSQLLLSLQEWAPRVYWLALIWRAADANFLLHWSKSLRHPWLEIGTRPKTKIGGCSRNIPESRGSLPRVLLCVQK